MAVAIGAWRFFSKNDIIVFECGTAITIDCVGKSGEYLGGNISLGLNTRLKALNLLTEKLLMGRINPDIPKIGKNT
jgi:type III pantothenate kinase